MCVCVCVCGGGGGGGGGGCARMHQKAAKKKGCTSCTQQYHIEEIVPQNPILALLQIQKEMEILFHGKDATKSS